jgi:hypothetical protein
MRWLLPPEEEVCAEREAYGRFYKFFYENSTGIGAAHGKALPCASPPPAKTTMELDELYGLPFAESLTRCTARGGFGLSR